MLRVEPRFRVMVRVWFMLSLGIGLGEGSIMDKVRDWL